MPLPSMCIKQGAHKLLAHKMMLYSHKNTTSQHEEIIHCCSMPIHDNSLPGMGKSGLIIGGTGGGGYVEKQCICEGVIHTTIIMEYH